MRSDVSPRQRAGAPAALRFTLRQGTAAAFTGRAHGNVSLVTGGGDPAAARRGLAPLVGAAEDAAVFMEQVHGPEVAIVTRADAGRGLAGQAGAIPGVDALVTAEADLPLAVLTADCVPVLLAAPGAVAAVHAGRAGLLSGVLERSLAAMAGLGAAAPVVTAVIGPAIGGCCYEVPQDLAARAGEQLPALRARTAWGTPSLDLPAGVAAVLRAAGVGAVAASRACTRCAPRDWFSHRAATDGREPSAPRGRQASVIALGAAAGGSEASGTPPRLPDGLTWLS